MRPPVQPSDPLLQFFDGVLGTVGAVRVLRELCAISDVVAPTTLAERTGIGRAGVHRVLTELRARRIVEAVGEGRTRLYRLAPDHPAGTALVRLFEYERAAAAAFEQEVRDACGALRPAAAWTFQAAPGEDESAVHLLVVGPQDAERGRSLEIRIRAAAERGGVAVRVTRISGAEWIRLALRRDPAIEGYTRQARGLYGLSPAAAATDPARLAEPG